MLRSNSNGNSVGGSAGKSGTISTMMGGRKRSTLFTTAARRLTAASGTSTGDTLSPNSVRTMLNDFRRPLGLALVEDVGSTRIGDGVSKDKVARKEAIAKNEALAENAAEAKEEVVAKNEAIIQNVKVIAGNEVIAENEATPNVADNEAVSENETVAENQVVSGAKDQDQGPTSTTMASESFSITCLASKFGTQCSLDNDTHQPASTTSNRHRPSIFGPFQTPKPRKCDVPLKTNSNKKRVKPKQQQNPTNSWHLTTERVHGHSYLVIKEVGHGGSGQVYLVMENESKHLYALKKVNMLTLDTEMVQECVNEVRLLVAMRADKMAREYVVQIIEWEIDKNSQMLKIIMEYGQCDLAKALSATSQEEMTLNHVRALWENLLLIVNSIHEKGIVHGDLKPANFIYVNGRLKLIDFGIANRLSLDMTSFHTFNPKGTLNYMSPESVRVDTVDGAKTSQFSDVWSLGCILYQLVYGQPPFSCYPNSLAKIEAIIAGHVQYPPLRLNLLAPGEEFSTSLLLNIMQSCLRVHPKERPSVKWLLQHKCF